MYREREKGHRLIPTKVDAPFFLYIYIAQINERAVEKVYHFGTSGAFSNHGGHMARVRVLGVVVYFNKSKRNTILHLTPKKTINMGSFSKEKRVKLTQATMFTVHLFSSAPRLSISDPRNHNKRVKGRRYSTNYLEIDQQKYET